jgi:hypothetical protein
VASLQGLAPDRVVFVGTTSKTLAPALRLAWMVPPAGLLHRHCTARAPFPPALLLGFALPGESDLPAAVRLLAQAVR